MKYSSLSSWSFETPLYLAPSAWAEHLPFAFWLIENLRPKQFVELGVHYGVSYFAFCQAIKKNKIPAACYAIDNWTGDEHAGFYSNEIYEAVALHNRENYSGFSYLLRTDFNTAVTYFEDGSIDLLHIDGLHTYEAVKKDFETWFPRLSSHSVVLFHDIAVRNNNFGVFRFWNELQQKFPSFSFIHGHGLGVLGTGSNLPDALKLFFSQAADEEATYHTRDLFSQLGSTVSDKLQMRNAEQTVGTLVTEQAGFQHRLGEIRKEKDELGALLSAERQRNEELENTLRDQKILEITGQEKLNAASQRLHDLEKDMVALQEQHAKLMVAKEAATIEKNLGKEATVQLREEKKVLQNEFNSLLNELKSSQRALAEARNAEMDLHKETNRLNTESIERNQILQGQEGQLASYRKTLVEANKEKQELQAALENLENSFSWKVTRPLRWAKKNWIVLLTYVNHLFRQLVWVLQGTYGQKKNEAREYRKLYGHVPAQLVEDYKLLKTSEWFDEGWYLRQYADVRNDGADPALHYLTHGYHELRDPGPSFKTALYLERYPDVKLADANPLLHFLKHGQKEGRTFEPVEIEKKEPAASAPKMELPDYQDPFFKKTIDTFPVKPKISVIFPTYNTKPELLHLAIASVKNQIYTHWEICIADDCSTREATKQALQHYSSDEKIKVTFLKENSGISEASNAALKMATGEYIALMDHDDAVTPDALFWIVKEINEREQADIIYTDECKVDEQGNLSDYFLKPDWSPELLFNMMYVGHLTVYRKRFLLDQVGMFRKEFDFSQDYDLMLRAVEQTAHIYHVPKILYHWRITEGSSSQGDKPYARISNLAALEDARKRRNLQGEIIELPVANRIKLKVDESKKVSLVIPTDSHSNLKTAIQTITTSTSYANYEIIPVTNSKLANEMSELFPLPNISYAVYDKPYNFSDKCNTGVDHASGDIVIFFNDDVRVIQPDWLENTIEFLEVPGVGGVSPKLIYENETIQYAGMATGVRNLTGTTFHCYPANSLDYFNFPQLVRDVSILSGALLAMNKSLFLELGGFDAVNTPSSHSDVDLSFRILDAGYRCVYTPYACLLHIGHQSLGEQEKKEKIFKQDKSDIFLLKRWMKYLPLDPYFTEPMRNHLYHDSPEPFSLFAPSRKVTFGNKGDVLLVSHDLSLSGAPIFLYDVSKLLMENGYFVIVVCPEDGPLRNMYAEIGIPVMVDPLALRQHPSFERFARNFDFLIANTIATWSVVKQMQHLVKTIWWIQEGQVLHHFTANPDCLNTLKDATHLVGVSDYAISHISQYNRKITKIYNACYDININKKTNHTNGHGKIILSLIGSVEPRKGHDVLVRALELLPENMRNKMEVRFIGRILDHDFLARLKDRIDALGIIRMMGERQHNECLELINESDVVLNISRDDPFPVVLVEAMCLEKPCLVSSHSGLAELITNGKNGYVFKNEDYHDLKDRIIEIVEKHTMLNKIGQDSRKTWEQYLTIEKLNVKVNELMEAL